jgi:MFS family permease
VIPAAYRQLLRIPGVPRALGTSLLARTAYPTAGLALVLLTVERTGSYAAGGLVSAAWVGGIGLGGLVSSRLLDRGRPRLVLLATAATSALGLLVLALVPTSAPAALAGLTAVAALTAPPVVPAARALWPRLLPDETTRSSMYALEATFQELTFIVGPSLAAVCTALASPALGVGLAGALSLAGTAAFAGSPGLSRLGVPGAAATGPRRLAALAVPLAAYGLVIGGLSFGEVATIASAGRSGAPAAAGVLLAVWSGGSLLGGLVAGARPPRSGPQRRLLVLLTAVAAGTAALALAPGLVLLGVGLVLTGALVAPAFGAVYKLVEELAPPGAVARTFAALTTAGLAGAAAGAAVAGAVVDAAGPGAAFLAGGVTPALAAVLVAVGPRARDPAALAAPVPAEARR